MTFRLRHLVAATTLAAAGIIGTPGTATGAATPSTVKCAPYNSGAFLATQTGGGETVSLCSPAIVQLAPAVWSGLDVHGPYRVWLHQIYPAEPYGWADCFNPGPDTTTDGTETFDAYDLLGTRDADAADVQWTRNPAPCEHPAQRIPPAVAAGPMFVSPDARCAATQPARHGCPPVGHL